MKRITGVALGVFLLFGGVFGFQSSASTSDIGSRDAETQSEVKPAVIFSPNMCIIAKDVQKFGKGWRVNGTFILTKETKEGFFSPNPKVGKKICIMTDHRDDIVGWQVQ